MKLNGLTKKILLSISSQWPWTVIVSLAGVFQAMSLAWPSGGQPVWWLQIFALAVLCFALQRTTSAGHAAWQAWVFATTWLVATFWWLFVSMHTYGGLPAVLAVFAVFMLAAFLGCYYAVCMWIWRRWMCPGWQAVALFAVCWTLAELARGTLWTGFPWGAIGYAHVEGPLVIWPRWLGVYGTGAIAAVVAMALAQVQTCWRNKTKAALVMLAGCVVWLGGAIVFGTQDFPAPRPPVSVALLQGNIAQDEKFIPGDGIQKSLEWYGQRLLEAPAELVVAPETALPLLSQQLPQGYLEVVSAPYRRAGARSAALVGMPLGDAFEGYSNSMVGWIPKEMPEYRYDKHHLVPFGEFIPPLFQWFVRLMNIPLGDFERGGIGQASMQWRGERWAPNICYEDLFGEELAARFSDVANAPTVFVNASNIAWFGDTVAIDQHLHISRMRSLELERPMIRATNTGATAVIDHRGKVTASLPSATQAVLSAEVQGRDGITPYARWVSQWGLWPLWLCCVAVVVFCALSRKKIRAKQE